MLSAISARGLPGSSQGHYTSFLMEFITRNGSSRKRKEKMDVTSILAWVSTYVSIYAFKKLKEKGKKKNA